MSEKVCSVPESVICKAVKQFGSPIYIYDEAAIRAQARSMREAFGVFLDYRNYFAVKACSNPAIMRILAEEGMGMDCSSLPELVLSNDSKWGVQLAGESIMFTSNNTPLEEYQKALEIGAIINIDDLTHVRLFKNGTLPVPEMICFRYNPGSLAQGNSIIGDPTEAKYGLTHDQMIKAYGIMKQLGVKHFGLHAMLVSNELDEDVLAENARIIMKMAAEIHDVHGIDFDFVNLGGGIGIPYRPEDEAVDLSNLSDKIYSHYKEIFRRMTPGVFTECGRCVTGPHGYLATRVIHFKHTHREYIGVDASMADLMRPGMYGAYHHITVLGKEDDPTAGNFDVVGSLCENCDKFAVQRPLPQTEIGDVLVIHDAGAHGRAMGFNYNGKLRCGEVLWCEDGSLKLIRRHETMDDLFATLHV